MIGVPCFGGVGWMVVAGQESGYGVSGDRCCFGGCGICGRRGCAVERPSFLEKLAERLSGPCRKPCSNARIVGNGLSTRTWISLFFRKKVKV
jgi:hypothetical protein